MRNLKNKLNEQTKLRQTHRMNCWLPEGRGFGTLGERGEGIKKKNGSDKIVTGK